MRKPAASSKGEPAAFYATTDGYIQFAAIGKENDLEDARRIATAWGMELMGFALLMDGRAVMTKSLPLELDDLGRMCGITK